MKPGIIDYGGGNLQSVRNAVRALGYDPVLVHNPEDLEEVSALVFPGQGAFADCMGALNSQGLTDALKEWLAADRPFFGICIGYQVLFEGGEENPGVAGLGILRGQVVRFPARSGLKVPHMGWNTVRPVAVESPAWAGLGSAPYFYYVHSFYPVPADSAVVAARTDYADIEFAAAVQQGRMIATQFHPEKSQDTGLRLLGNFLTVWA
jgi:imidazole glycerol phosphate synthase glutamine amidotransferase subunit